MNFFQVIKSTIIIRKSRSKQYEILICQTWSGGNSKTFLGTWLYLKRRESPDILKRYERYMLAITKIMMNK